MINYLLNFDDFDSAFDSTMKSFDVFSILTIIIPIIVFIIIVSVVITFVVKTVKFKKNGIAGLNVEKESKSIFDIVKDNIEEQTRTHITCEYCGSSNEKSRTSCEKCGANLKRKN